MLESSYKYCVNQLEILEEPLGCNKVKKHERVAPDCGSSVTISFEV
jgi:hypothetical protein